MSIWGTHVEYRRWPASKWGDILLLSDYMSALTMGVQFCVLHGKRTAAALVHTIVLDTVHK